MGRGVRLQSRAIGSYGYAQVVDTHLVEGIQFVAQAFLVAALSLASQYGSVPEIGSHKVVFIAVKPQPPVMLDHITFA